MDRARVTGALPGYELGEPLGRGAMGEVLGGRHRDLDRVVAIKGLPGGLAGDPEVRRRFGVEARVLASLSHPHVVPVFDYVERDGLCLLVMEALPGGTVWDRFCRDGVTMAGACAVALATCVGLQHAHERRVLHRDIKPENLMFDRDQVLKVTDFGIAGALGGDGQLATASGEVIGTPAYMAPEQSDGSPIGPQADVYAVATVLYELLCGQLPFDITSDDPMDLLRSRLNSAPRPLRDVAPEVPEPLAAVVMRGLERDPAERTQTAEAFGAEVAAAASAAWGPAWLSRAGVGVMAGGAIAEALAGDSNGATRTDPMAARSTIAAATGSRATADTVAPGSAAGVHAAPGTVMGPAGLSAPATVAPTGPHSSPVARETAAPAPTSAGPTPIPPAPATMAAGAVAPTSSSGEGSVDGGPDRGAPADETSTAVEDRPRRPTQSFIRRSSPDLTDVRPDQVVPLASAVKRRRISWPSGLVAAVLLTLGVLLGLGVPSMEQAGPTPSQLAVNGQPVGRDPVPVDLARPMTVTLGAVPAGASTAQLRLSLAGLPMGSSNIRPLGTEPGGAVTLSATSARLFASGPVTADLELRDAAGNVVETREFVIDPEQSPFLTVGGLAAGIGAAAAIAWGWAASAHSRMGRRRIGSFVTMAISGAVLGAFTVLLGWSTGAGRPTTGSFVVPAVVCAAGALVFGWFLLTVGRVRRRRARLARRREALRDRV